MRPDGRVGDSDGADDDLLSARRAAFLRVLQIVASYVAKRRNKNKAFQLSY